MRDYVFNPQGVCHGRGNEAGTTSSTQADKPSWPNQKKNQFLSTGGGGRTLTPLRALDFESSASAIPPLRRVPESFTRTTHPNNEIVGRAALWEGKTNRTGQRSQGDASRECQFLMGGTDSSGKTGILEKSSLGEHRHGTLNDGSPNHDSAKLRLHCHFRGILNGGLPEAWHGALCPVTFRNSYWLAADIWKTARMFGGVRRVSV